MKSFPVRGRQRSSNKSPKDAEANFDKASKPFVLKWAPVKAGALLGALLMAGVYVRHIYRVKHPDASVVQAQSQSATIQQWTGGLPLEVANHFVQAQTQKERLKWVRNPEQMEDLMNEFYGNGPGAHEKVRSVVETGISGLGTEAYEQFSAVMTDESTRMLCVVVNEGEAKVDFKSYARYGSASWDALLSGKKSQASEVRVYVKPGNYYNLNFADENDWQCFIATSPDLPDPIYFYMARSNAETDSLTQRAAMDPVEVTVAIRALGDSYRARQFEITRLIQGSWVTNQP